MSATREDIHLHWQFLAYNDAEAFANPQGQGQSIQWPVTVTVIGYNSEDDAKVAARSMITRDQFQLRTVYECPRCGFEDAISETQKEMLNVLRDASR